MIYFIINDNSAGRLAVKVQPDLSGSSRMGVIIDQIVPANSSETSIEQKNLREWAERYQIPFSYGRVTTGALLSGDRSAGFGWMIGAGDIVAATIPEVYAAERLGAVGICLPDGEFVKALKSGRLPECGKPDYPNIRNEKSTIKELESVMEKADDRDSMNRKPACVYLGGMGGFLPDIRLAAEMVEGKHIAEGVRFLISPASAKIYCEAADAGYFAAIMEAGGMVLNQCASPAVQGRIGEHEIMVSNDCHDETGFAGPESSRIILASTKTAVNCALTGVLGKSGKEGA